MSPPFEDPILAAYDETAVSSIIIYIVIRWIVNYKNALYR